MQKKYDKKIFFLAVSTIQYYANHRLHHHHHHYLFLLLLLLLLLPLALQPTVGFGLSNNILPFFPICHQLSPSSHSQHLKISFYFLFPSFPGSSPFASSLPVLEWRSFWAPYPPPFTLGDLTSLSFTLLSILLYLLLCSSLLVLDSSDFSIPIPRFHISDHYANHSGITLTYCAESTLRLIPLIQINAASNIVKIIITLFPFLPYNSTTISRWPTVVRGPGFDNLMSWNETRVRQFVSVEDVAKMREPDYILLVQGQGNRQRIHGSLYTWNINETLCKYTGRVGKTVRFHKKKK